MSLITREHLKAGIIFGDHATGEYIYLPGGEVGLTEPVCVLETAAGRRDLSLAEAAAWVQRLSLKPVRHPKLGQRSY